MQEQLNKGSKFFPQSKSEPLDTFIIFDNKDVRIYAYEIVNNKSAFGTHICSEFLEKHLDLFEDVGFWEVLDDEILYNDIKRCNNIHKIKAFGVIIKEDKVGEFNGYSMYI